jgi:serine/threonine protein kinase
VAVKEQTSSFEPKPFGRYVLTDKLAVGGMAEIYKAKTYGVDGFEKVLAVKRILPHCAADPEFINMLVDEAKLTVLLSHANIVQVFDLGKVGDDYFISMEYINGTNLREVMNRYPETGDKIPEEIAVYILSEVSKGLDYAHRKTDSQGNPLHIVHRDISPQNILISYEGEVKIVDFGIAKAAMNVSHTMAGILKGKIAYMSPEQALGKPIDHRTDIFSAGVVLYELLTGEKLFTGETQFEVLNQIRTTRINTLMLPDAIPGPLKAILAKSLAYNAKDRYQSAGDFQLDLTKYLYSSYIDFSPRQLSAILNRLFEKEIKRKEAPVTIDEKTRSVLVKQVGLENIVVHGQAKVAEAAPRETQVSAVLAAPTEKRGRRPWAPYAGGLAALVAVAYLGYTFVVKPILEKPAVTTPETPAAPVVEGELGSIAVETTPPGAKILLNGRETGLTTPATLPKLAVGDEYEVRVALENYREFRKTVAVTSETPVKIQETLQPLPKGVIEVDSNPRGARIVLNDQETGLTTPSKIENLEIQKTYQVKVLLPNYYEWSQAAEVKDFNPVRLAMSLVPVPPPPATTPTVPAVPATTTPPATATVPPATTTPSTPPTPAVSYGSVKISSTPAGARIFLNGAGTGKTTPATLEKLESGKKVTIGLVKDGYSDWSRTVTVEKEKATPLYAALKEIPKTAPTPPAEEPKTPERASVPERSVEPEKAVSGRPGSLSISSDPSGAEVYVNAEYKGTTPIKVSNINPGTVKVVVNKDGYMRYTSSVRIEPGETKSLGTIQLGGFYGEVSIRSTPPRATVYFDGEQIARTPVTIRRVPRDKSHTLRIKLDGFRDWETTVSLRDSETKKYDVLLEKE